MTISIPTKSRPIIMTGESVRAILDGSKTMTRRIANFGTVPGDFPNFVLEPWPQEWIAWWTENSAEATMEFTRKAYKQGDGIKCPYGRIGDELFVKEAFELEHEVDGNPPRYSDGRPVKLRGDGPDEEGLPLWAQPHYRATDPTPQLAYPDSNEPECRWRSPLFMPRWASRLTLRITSVRVERLHAITEADARAEGCANVAEFRKRWEKINGNWRENCWVWVVEFRKVDREDDR